MKLSKEIWNSLLIFIGIGAYFLILDSLGLTKNYYLRLVNVLFVFYGVNRTLESNIKEGKTGYVFNLRSSTITAILGVILSVAALIVYIHYNGGVEYLQTLSQASLFSNTTSVNEYGFGILFEGIASAVIVVFILMQYWRRKMRASK